MGAHEPHMLGSGHSSDTTSFRRLVEEKISADEYVKRLRQRVRDRRANEETPRPRAGAVRPQKS